MKDDLDLNIPEDHKRCRERALKLAHHGSLDGRYPVRIDKRTIIFKRIPNGIKHKRTQNSV